MIVKTCLEHKIKFRNECVFCEECKTWEHCKSCYQENIKVKIENIKIKKGE